MNSAKACEFCDKRGLPLMLVRDAVANTDCRAPRASKIPIELPEKLAYYTKRILRSGYVNVFDEARRRWESYFVTPDGYFSKLMQTPGVAPAVPRKPFNCPDASHRAIASCITIPDPVNASKIWIGFSDVLWTDAVRKMNEDPVYRKRHMTEIDVKAVLKGNATPHQKIGDLSRQVAEYAMATVSNRVSIGWSPFNFNARQGGAEQLVNECEKLRPGCGLIVTLSDPAGIAQELAALMKVTAIAFIETRAEDKRNLAASAAIEQIKEGICIEAERSEIAAADRLADDLMSSDPIGHMMFESTRKNSEQIRNLSSTDLKRASINAWKKYDSKYDDKARQLWLKGFDERFAKFDRENIAPLAAKHVQWMQSKEMMSYFECNYDMANAESGAVYTQVVTNCISDTQGRKACARLYETWLESDISEKRNFILRALVLNQAVTIDAIKNISTVNVGPQQIPWDNVFAAHNSAVEKLSRATQDVSAQLVAFLGGPIVRALNRVMDGTAGFRSLMMSLGIVAKQPIVLVDVTDTAKNFEKYLTRALIEAHGRPLNERRLGELLKNELRRRQIHGVQLQGNTSRRWVISIDEETLSRMPANLKTKQSEKWTLRSLKTVEEIEALNLNRWRNVISTSVRQGTVAAILQTANLMKLLADEEKTLKNDKEDATWRRQAGVATLGATVSEVLGNFLDGRAGQGMRFGQGLASKSGGFLKYAGAKAGILAGLVMAGLDFNKARSEYEEGSDGVVVGAYVGSGLAGILLTLALINAWAFPVIVLLLLVVVGIGILIEHVKDNPIQDWLERCPWGNLKSQRYSDFSTEQAQLELAFR